jgi:hypothetical protein
MDCTTFTLLYTALVKLRLEYANQVWCPYLKKNIESIENVKEDRDRTVGPQCRNLRFFFNYTSINNNLIGDQDFTPR